MSRAEPVHDPRIAKKEMIVTRFKSAQQRKQQQNAKKPEKNSQIPLNVMKIPHHKVYKSPHSGTKSPQTVTKLPQTITKPQESVAKVSQTEKCGPPKNKPSKKAIPKKSSHKSKEKRVELKSPILIEDEYPEYYPDKCKRAPGSRKVFLKPKQKSTMVARTNKRKFNTPRRGIKSPLADESASSHTESRSKCQGPVYSELSMAEVIRIVEENDSLDDEDLMEILTCPSPVWWEEPPDEMYIEEAICSRKPDENGTGKTKSPIRERCMNTLRNSVKYGDKIITQTSNEDSTSSNQKTEVKKDDKFMKKSKKLENVLGNIKNKVSKDNEAGRQEESDDMKTTQSGTDAKSINDISLTSDPDKNNSKTDIDEVNTEVKDMKIENASIRKTKKLSESTDGSLGDFNQEMLLDLENMVIPVRDCVDLNSPDCVIINDVNSGKIIDVDDLDCKSDDNKDHEINNKDDCNSNTEIKSDLNGSNKESIEKEANSEITNVIEQTEVPENMPPLIKCPKFENVVFTSPSSCKSITDDVTESSSVSGVDIMDTISDTNIKFITDDDVDDVSDGDDRNKNNEERLHDKNEVTDSKVESNVKDKENLTELDEMTVLTNTKDTKSKDSYITVYKIVSGDDAAPKPKNIFKNIPEYSSYVENLIQSESKIDTTTDESLENDIPDLPIDVKGQLNSFFKKCKNANRKRKRVDVPEKTDDENGPCESPKKSITVAQDENVKYCMKCSSIFDTDDCRYCLKTQKDAKSEPEKKFTCDKCDFVGESKSKVNIHSKEHVTEDESKT